MLERPQINTWVMQGCSHHLAGDTLSYQSQSGFQVSYRLLWIVVWRGGFVVLNFVLPSDTFFFKAGNHNYWEWQKFPHFDFLMSVVWPKHTVQMPIIIITFSAPWPLNEASPGYSDPVKAHRWSVHVLFQQWLHSSAGRSDHCILLTYLTEVLYLAS